eukprot:15473410-Alexandrium_andersonii.AAC.1
MRLATAVVVWRAASAAAARVAAARRVPGRGCGSTSPSCVRSRSHCRPTEPQRPALVGPGPGPGYGST